MTVPDTSPYVRKTRMLSLVVLSVTLLLTLPFRSMSLDDFDSYSFALALEQYDLALQQPQPPGFPVYVAAARALHALWPDPVLALTLLSALCGAASAWVVYQIGRQLDPQHSASALIAGLLFTTLPVGWLTSGKALTDMPGMFATLLSLWLWLQWRSERRALPPYAAAAITGLALGVRPQNGLPVAMLVGTYAVQDIISSRQRPRRERCALICWLKAAGVGLLGVLVWMVPVAALSGGLPPFIALISGHASHVGQADALFGMNMPLGRALRVRLIAFGDTGLLALTGVGVYPPQPPGAVARHLVWGLLIAAGALKADWQRWQTRGLGLWWLATALQVLLFETLDRPRLLLPLAPPLVLLIAIGWVRWVRRPVTRAVLLCGIFLATLLQTLPLVARLTQIPAPPAQATAYIQTHYPPDSTLVAAAGAFRAAQVGLNGYPLVYLYTFDPEAVAAMLTEHITHVAILDRDQFTPEAIKTLSRDGALVTIEDRLFSRDRGVHTQHDQVRLQILTSPELVPTQALTLPGSGCLNLGGPEDGRYLGQGWFRSEDIGGAIARWAGGELTSTLHLILPPLSDQTLRIRAQAYPPQQNVTVIVDDETVGSISLGNDWTEAAVALPYPLTRAGERVTVSLVHRVLTSPFEVSAGTSSDQRALAAAYDWICVVPTTSDSAQDAPVGED